MKAILYLVCPILILNACSKKEGRSNRPYVVEPTRITTTNYVRIKDLYGRCTIDSTQTQLTFIDFWTLPTGRDTFDSTLVQQQSLLNSYYLQYRGTWKIHYVGAVPLVTSDSVKLRLSNTGDFQQQILTFTVDRRLWGQPIFELRHEPTGTVYARYIAAAAGLTLELQFSGPRNAHFDTLSTQAIVDQLTYKLSPKALHTNAYVHTAPG